MATRRKLPGIDFERVRAELKIREEFPSAVIEEAKAAAASSPLPDSDDTNIPFVTLDPEGSRDLDQAVHIAKDGDGYLVHYAIADVAAYVKPGGALDGECWERGQTMYCPDKRVPLHPAELSEGAASLLPDQVCAAALWELRLDATGELVSATVRRTKIRSIAQLNYVQTQQDFDSGTAHDSLALLAEVGPKRLEIARARHAINLNLPEQEVDEGANGWRINYRSQLPCELWNAEISLLTGMAAGQLMLEAGAGILRTLPPAPQETIDEVRRTAQTLGIEWPDGAHPSDVLDGLDRSNARNVAFIEQAAHLLRGAGYLGFIEGRPEDAVHAAIGAIYAHVTAPLRRLVDRYGTEVCLAHCAGEPVPDWVRDALPKLPEVMSRTGSLESRLENAVLDAVEALLLQGSVGREFPGDVVGVGKDDVTVVLHEPAVRAKAKGSAALGEVVTVKVLAADPIAGTVRLEVVGHADSH